MRSNEEIIAQVKSIVYKYDENADVVFFGSRKRGDWHEESDWDFLILSDINVTEKMKDALRKDILYEIEFKTFESIQTIWHNKKVWEDDNWVTGIYQSIKEDGVLV